MSDWLLTWGYVGLFIVCFLSSSVVPMTSEFLLIAMQQTGYNVWLILIVASTGNYFGSLTSYFVGKYGANYVLSRYFEPSPKRREQATQLYNRWGAPILFFSWVPLIGDALTMISGILHGNLWVFTFWVALGKFVRFAAVLKGFEIILDWMS